MIFKKAAENKVQPKNKVLEDIAKTIHASGKVKQMVELHEARIKPYGNTLNTPPTVQKPHAIRQLQYTNSKFKTTNSTSTSISNNTDNSKIRSSIDKRKIRISNQKAKAENKYLVLAGCVPQGAPKAQYIQGCSIIGVQQIDRIVEVVEQTLNGNSVRLFGKTF